MCTGFGHGGKPRAIKNSLAGLANYGGSFVWLLSPTRDPTIGPDELKTSKRQYMRAVSPVF